MTVTLAVGVGAGTATPPPGPNHDYLIANLGAGSTLVITAGRCPLAYNFV